MKLETVFKAVGWIAFGALVANKGHFVLLYGIDAKTDIPVYNWVGLLFMGAGLPFIGYGMYLLFRTRKFEPVKSDFICPVCESVHSLIEKETQLCPHDGTEMEPLKGYYDRHPERRDKPITPNK